jgi:drug/metabolite transporter (DMT)-like permease
MERQKKAYLYALLAVLLWSTVASAFKLTLRYMDSTALLLISSLTSTLVLFIILLANGEIRQLKLMKKNDWLRSAGLGFLNPFLYYLVLFKAYTLLPAQEAQPLNYTWGIVVTLLSVPLLGQKITALNIIALVISFGGVIIISTKGDFRSFNISDPLGVGLAVGSSLIWALYWIYNIKDSRSEIVKLFINFVFGSLFVVAWYVISGAGRIEISPGIAGAVYTGIFEMGITFVVWLKALKYTENTATVSNIIYLSPFLSLFFINLLVGEKILLTTVIGLALIIGGIVIQQYGTRLRRL